MTAFVFVKHPSFERGPDEEGIETRTPERSSFAQRFERGPDEEGIETDFDF